MALSGRVVPKANEGLAGVTATETSVADPIVSVADELIEPELAEIVAVPAPAPVARPPEVMVATETGAELQATELVTFCVLPSLKVPVAVNCWLPPLAIEALDGLIDSDVRTAEVTVNAADPLIVPDDAVIVADPGAIAEARPPLLTVATAVFDDAHVTEEVRFCVEPLL